MRVARPRKEEREWVQVIRVRSVVKGVILVVANGRGRGSPAGGVRAFEVTGAAERVEQVQWLGEIAVIRGPRKQGIDRQGRNVVTYGVGGEEECGKDGRETVAGSAHR